MSAQSRPPSASDSTPRPQSARGSTPRSLQLIGGRPIHISRPKPQPKLSQQDVYHLLVQGLASSAEKAERAAAGRREAAARVAARRTAELRALREHERSKRVAERSAVAAESQRLQSLFSAGTAQHVQVQQKEEQHIPATPVRTPVRFPIAEPITYSVVVRDT